jgi:hypothetical protein
MMKSALRPLGLMTSPLRVRWVWLAFLAWRNATVESTRDSFLLEE